MSIDLQFVCIDLQNDFASKGGLFYVERPSVRFVLDELFPYLREKELKISEIVSDYRQPRPGDERDGCRPGEWGYGSLVPQDLLKGRRWVKSMNSPVWTRDGIGDPTSKPGLPYPDPEGFGNWITQHIGSREDVTWVVLFGLTADCCVLSAVQEFRWRGFNVKVLTEATDVRSSVQGEKVQFLSTPPFTFWGDAIDWEMLRTMLG